MSLTPEKLDASRNIALQAAAMLDQHGLPYTLGVAPLRRDDPLASELRASMNKSEGWVLFVWHEEE